MKDVTFSFKGIYRIFRTFIAILLIKTIVKILSRYNKTTLFVVILKAF